MKFYKEIHSAYKGKRPIFHEMLQDLKTNKAIKWIIVMKWDRISRNPDDYLQLQNTRGADNPIDIISVTEPMISSYLGRYMVRDLQNRAILYSEELSFRVKLGQRKKMQLGWYTYLAPYGYKNWNGYLVEDNENNKADIIRFIFEVYAIWHIWFKDLAKLIRNQFKLETFSWRKIEHIIGNSIYYGVVTKKWHLSNDEYIFFWTEKPGDFVEKYELNNVKTIITKELFDRCQQLRKAQLPHKYVRTGLAKYPKIFQCVCGRKLRRYDKKWNRYLACWKEVNSVHPMPCWERHTPLGCIEDDLRKIVTSIIPPKEVRSNYIKEIQGTIMNFCKDNNFKVSDNLRQSSVMKEKITELTRNYASGNISLEVFNLASNQLSEEIQSLNKEVRIMENEREYIGAWKRAIRFFEILGEYSKIIEEGMQDKLKSSRLYSIVFKVAGNLTIYNRNISSYELNYPFNFLQVPDFCTNRKMGDSNPRYLAVHIVSNDARSTTLPTFHDLSSNHRERLFFFKRFLYFISSEGDASLSLNL